MTWIIIGSTAAHHWFPDFRAPVDLDLLTPNKVCAVGSTGPFLDCQWHQAAEALINASANKVFLDADLLFTLKVSHAEWDVKWDKTLFDIEFFKRKGCSLNMPLYKELFQVWTTVHGKKRVNLNQELDVFFTSAVKRKYNHEWLHEHLAFYSRPLHEAIRTNLQSAWCSEDLFNGLSLDDKLKCALEEIMVIAVERHNLTAKSQKSDISTAMNKAHKQLVTTMTTGWFALFLILNRYDLLFGLKTIWMPHLQQKLRLLP